LALSRISSFYFIPFSFSFNLEISSRSRKTKADDFLFLVLVLVTKISPAAGWQMQFCTTLPICLAAGICNTVLRVVVDGVMDYVRPRSCDDMH